MTALSKYQKLISNLKEGDANSFELVFRRLYPRLCTYANMLVNSMSDAEDIVQESFYRIWKTRDSLHPDKPVDSYLFITVRNSCLNFLEHRKAVSKHAKIMSDVYSGSSDDNSSYELLIAKDLETEFNEALDKLPPECRRIFELSRFEGLKNTEIAARLDISIKTVENQMTRALYKIRLRLKPYLVSVHIFVSFYISVV